MSKYLHTPGPWRYTISAPHKSSFSSDRTSTIRTIQIHTGNGEHDSDKVITSTTVNIVVGSEDLANVRLMAASTEMYDVLLELQRLIEKGRARVSIDGASDWFERFGRALNKAEEG